MIAGVIMEEAKKNVNYIDLFQDKWLKAMLQVKNDDWWEEWKTENENQCELASEVRQISNKWPLSIVSSGYVMSFGLGQITPRTVLKACDQTKCTISVCCGNTKEIISKLIKTKNNIKLTAVTLYYEYIRHQQITGEDVRTDLRKGSLKN